MKKIIMFFWGVILSFSCSDVLDLKPLDSYNSEAIFSDVTLSEIFVNQRYEEIVHGFAIASRWICDETFAQHNVGAQEINTGGMTPDETGGFDTWGKYYQSIRQCNIFLENVENIPQENEERKQMVDRMKGEIIFLRAFFYFDLANRYNGVPLITCSFTPNDDMMLSRNTYEECMDFVLEELDKAIDLLPCKHDSKNFGRATKGAAMGYKARALLYMASPLHNTTHDVKKWEAAAIAAKEVIDLTDENGNPVYGLDADYGNLFLNSQSPEIIFHKLFNNERATYIQMTELPSGYGESWASSCVTQELVDAYEMKNGKLPSEVGSMYDPQNPYVNREPRFYASILFDGAMYKGREVECWINDNPEDIFNSGLDSDKNPVGDWNASRTRYTMRKFMDESIDFILFSVHSLGFICVWLKCI